MQLALGRPPLAAERAACERVLAVVFGVLGLMTFGGTMLEENVVSAAGCFNLAPIQKLENVIARAGFTPRKIVWRGPPFFSRARTRCISTLKP